LRTSIIVLTGIFFIALIEYFIFEHRPADAGREMSFPTYNDAQKAGVFQNNLLPVFMPASATNIKENHILDTREQWLTFQFDAGDRSKMLEKLTPATISEVTFPRIDPTIKRVWWPADLCGPSNHPPQKYDLFLYSFRVAGGDGTSKSYKSYLAIEKDAPRAWYWHLSL
jgi:hypothetical protein